MEGAAAIIAVIAGDDDATIFEEVRGRVENFARGEGSVVVLFKVERSWTYLCRSGGGHKKRAS